MTPLAQAHGASAAPTLPQVTPDIDTSSEAEPESPYTTLLWNDPVNLVTQVTYVLMEVFGFDRVKAEAVMWEAHTNGRAVVFSGSRAKAEEKALQLLSWHLQATVEKA